MSIIPGFYRHIKSGEVYRVLGTGAAHDNPDPPLELKEQTIYYQQLKDKKKHNTNEIIPEGYIWHDEYDSFIKRFECNVPSK